MLSTRLLTSLIEFGFLVTISGLIIVVIYQIFLRAGTKGFDSEDAIKNDNVAVGILMATIMVSSALMLQKGLSASMGVFRLTMATPAETGLLLSETLLLVLAHLLLSLTCIVVTLFVTLQLFNILNRKINPEMQMDQLLRQGNVAVGIVLSAVVLITTIYAGDGISAVTKSLVPQPNVGTVRIMK
jgi:uncharacterized membrane protein YjfL (UPF0719 family)